MPYASFLTLFVCDFILTLRFYNQCFCKRTIRYISYFAMHYVKESS